MEKKKPQTEKKKSPVKKTNLKKSKGSGTACTVSGCTCDEYVQPDTGHACKTCGHYSGKHTG